MLVTTPAKANIARHLPAMARERPDQVAVVMGEGRDRAGITIYRRLSFAELDRVSDRYAWGLSGIGLTQGTRVLSMVPAGLPLISMTFALMKLGAVPILIDPAMGRRNLVKCIEECEPQAMVGVPRAHVARMLFPRAFKTVQRSIMVGSRLAPFGDFNLADLSPPLDAPFPLAPVHANDDAAIIFTTGSTGVPKGVLYSHGMFEAQVRLLRNLFQLEPGEIEMPAFPLFALFNVALGCTSAIPPIDPTRPASCDPAAVVECIQDQAVTSTFGSPAIWRKVTTYCLEKNIRLPTLRRVMMAGAPVPADLHERFRAILDPLADTHTPYGATEALPIASINGREVQAANAARGGDPLAGTCVGRAVPEVTLRIIPITDEAIATWDETLALPAYQVGEIVVKGPAVTHRYINRPEATAKAKIAEGTTIWHRMGDLGYLDDEGRLWFYGRKSHRVETGPTHGTLYSEPVELVFNQNSAVARSALVGIGPSGAQEPVVIIEPREVRIMRDPAAVKILIGELRNLGARYPMTAPIQRFLLHPAFPVDIRHNAKIFREQLALWAAEQRG
ncbi:fatty acid CoA ligase family protein [Candidatus Viridilinea mediisalina]|uniref:Peptide synthase n=1 Tax=Candidatus Viridilinea mediisalina TaxID=2024553 RepID=A0A2A6RJU0_9CHLR|nr:fatty acid CoA ligase family protein [Candidatus Viridilinea mediisalina]PDW03384.1 peptide synthase [Candidatus Viridilinea mediisalina]